MFKTGHMVIFDGPESFILHKETGAINLIKDDGVNYTLGLTVVPKAEFEKMEAEHQAGFHWQAR
jgi:hypothetical protein